MHKLNNETRAKVRKAVAYSRFKEAGLEIIPACLLVSSGKIVNLFRNNFTGSVHTRLEEWMECQCIHPATARIAPVTKGVATPEALLSKKSKNRLKLLKRLKRAAQLIAEWLK
jgi:hypothetical protein